MWCTLKTKFLGINFVFFFQIPERSTTSNPGFFEFSVVVVVSVGLGPYLHLNKARDKRLCFSNQNKYLAL